MPLSDAIVFKFTKETLVPKLVEGFAEIEYGGMDGFIVFYGVR